MHTSQSKLWASSPFTWPFSLLPLYQPYLHPEKKPHFYQYSCCSMFLCPEESGLTSYLTELNNKIHNYFNKTGTLILWVDPQVDSLNSLQRNQQNICLDVSFQQDKIVTVPFHLYLLGLELLHYNNGKVSCHHTHSFTIKSRIQHQIYSFVEYNLHTFSFSTEGTVLQKQIVWVCQGSSHLGTGEKANTCHLQESVGQCWWANIKKRCYYR